MKSNFLFAGLFLALTGCGTEAKETKTTTGTPEEAPALVPPTEVTNEVPSEESPANGSQTPEAKKEPKPLDLTGITGKAEAAAFVGVWTMEGCKSSWNSGFKEQIEVKADGTYVLTRTVTESFDTLGCNGKTHAVGVHRGNWVLGAPTTADGKSTYSLNWIITSATLTYFSDEAIARESRADRKTGVAYDEAMEFDTYFQSVIKTEAAGVNALHFGDTFEVFGVTKVEDRFKTEAAEAFKRQ